MIAEIVNGCVQEYPVTMDTLNEFEFVIAMPKDMIASVVVQDLQNMTHWGVHASIQCTIASKGKLKAIANNREKDRIETEHEISVPMQVSTQTPIEELMSKMMTGILNSVDEKLKSLSDKSLPCVSNQSFMTDKVIPSPEIASVTGVQNSSEGKGEHLVHRAPHLSFF